MRRNTKIFLAILFAGFLSLLSLVAVVVSAFLTPDFGGLTSQVEVPVKLADGSKSTRPMGPTAPGWVRLSEISNNLITAVISSEDTAFYQHEGVDFHEMKEALKKDLEEKRWARGASTITQQVVKNVYLTQEKTVTRKIKEIIWARALDKKLTKQQILCFYLNMVEWGPGIYGIRQAAQHYFGATPANLSPKQSAFLTMLIPSPVKYHNLYFTKKTLSKWASSRVNHILKIMNKMGYLDADAYQVALRQSLWGETPILTEGDEVPPVEGDQDAADEVAAKATGTTSPKASPGETPEGDSPLTPSPTETAKENLPNEGSRESDSTPEAETPESN